MAHSFFNGGGWGRGEGGPVVYDKSPLCQDDPPPPKKKKRKKKKEKKRKGKQKKERERGKIKNKK